MTGNELMDLTSVQPCPADIQIASLNQDGSVQLAPLAWMAFQIIVVRGIEGRPVTREWFSRSRLSFVFWERANEHSNGRSGRCECGYKECRVLGIIDTGVEATQERLLLNAQARQSALEAVVAKKEKARAYARERNQLSATGG